MHTPLQDSVPIETIEAEKSKTAMQELYAKLITGSHILHYHGVLDAYGHLSVRHPVQPDVFIMSRDMAPGTISSPSELIEYHVENAEPLNPSSSPGYSERCIHSEIYKKYPDIQSVIHSHSDAVVPYSITGVPLKPCFHMAGFLGKKTPVFDIEEHVAEDDCPDMLVRNVHLGAALATHFSSQKSEKSDHTVVLMRGHGFTVIAPDIQQCVLRAIYTQKNASIQTVALTTRAAHFGAATHEAPQIKYLSDSEAKCSAAMTSWSAHRPWGLWVREVEAAGLYVNSTTY